MELYEKIQLQKKIEQRLKKELLDNTEYEQLKEINWSLIFECFCAKYYPDTHKLINTVLCEHIDRCVRFDGDIL